MCAQFGLNVSQTLSERVFGTKIPTNLSRLFEDNRVLPYRKAPVLVAQDTTFEWRVMSYSLVPKWSKTARVKFATHNARLETIAEKPTWRSPFRSQHCLVPMSYFVEPIYHNEYAGFMVQFHEKKDGLMCAAGIWDSWVNKDTGEIVESFAIITTDPPKQILDIGHDRCPVFLGESDRTTWLGAASHTADEWKGFLQEHSVTLEFSVEKDRPMRPGWEKRA